MRHLEIGDRRGGQKVLIPTTDESRNVDGEGGSFWMAGQVRHLKKEDQKVLIPTIDLSRNVDGVSRSFWMAG